MHRWTHINRSFVVVALALLLVATSVVPTVALAGNDNPKNNHNSPQDWELYVGASSKDGAIQANFFLPRQVWIHVNDTITWKWTSSEIHTVTFLSGQKPSFPGAPMAPFPSPDSATYDGSGQISSGVKNDGTGGAFPAGTYAVTFTNTGDFRFDCLLHTNMSGVVHVRRTGQRLPHDQDWYTRQASLQSARMLKEGREVMAEGAKKAAKAGPTQVIAGYGEVEDTGTFSILRFLKQETWVKVNDTVTFTVRDRDVPHTATFGVEPQDPTAIIPPSGLATIGAGFDPKADSVNSGILSVQDLQPIFPYFIGPKFQVKFTAAGDYEYICALHDFVGMKGVVHVR